MSSYRVKKTLYHLEFKHRMCAEYHSSGLSVRQFAEAQGLKYTTFKNWLYRKEQEPPAFVPMLVKSEAPIVSSSASTPCATPNIHLVCQKGSNRIELHLPASAQSACLQWLGELLK